MYKTSNPSSADMIFGKDFLFVYICTFFIFLFFLFRFVYVLSLFSFFFFFVLYMYFLHFPFFLLHFPFSFFVLYICTFFIFPFLHVCACYAIIYESILNAYIDACMRWVIFLCIYTFLIIPISLSSL